MSQKSKKIKKFLIIFLISILLLTLGVTQTKNQNLLNLFDGVPRTNASTGNISPTLICRASGTYSQSPTVATLSDINLTTPLDTP